MIRAFSPIESRQIEPSETEPTRVELRRHAPERRVDLNIVAQASHLSRGHAGYGPALGIHLLDFGIVGHRVLIGGDFNTPAELRNGARSMADEELWVTWPGGRTRGTGIGETVLRSGGAVLLGVTNSEQQPDGRINSNARIIDLSEKPSGLALVGIERDGSDLYVSLEEAGWRGADIEHEVLIAQARQGVKEAFDEPGQAAAAGGQFDELLQVAGISAR